MAATVIAALGSRGEPMRFKQSQATAAQRTWLFHLALSASGADATGLVPVMTLSKAGAAFGAAGAAITEVSGGWYKAVFTTTDLNTVGQLAVNIAVATADPINVCHFVEAVDLSDGVRMGLTALPNAIFGANGGLSTGAMRGGTAQAGAASTITLDAGASATDHLYEGLLVQITAGTGAGQVRMITGYVGATKVATVERAWATNPDNTSVFELVGDNPVLVDQVTLKDSSLTAAKVASDAFATFAGRLESKPTVLVGTLTAVVTSVLRSMKRSFDTKVVLAGTFNGATVKIETTQDENAIAPVWTDQSAGGLTADGTTTLTGPFSAWRARVSAGAVTSVTVKATDRVPQTVS